jgi:hypothetical protein
MYCTFCGAGLPSSALFCSKCGSKSVPQVDHEENITFKNKLKSDSSIPDVEVNPLLSKEFRKSKNLGKKMCLGCGLVVDVFSDRCLTCKGTMFRWPDPDPNLEATPRTRNNDTNSQTRNQNFLSLNKDSKVLIFGISGLVISLLLIFSLYQSKINPNIEGPTPVATNIESTIPGESGNSCLKLEVESPYDSAAFYVFQVYITNKCSYRVKVAGYFYVKTINGSIFERPDDGTISFYGNNICGLHGNYLNYTFNPGEYSSDSVCNSVQRGDSVVSYFIADNPDGKPILQLSGNWLLE